MIDSATGMAKHTGKLPRYRRSKPAKALPQPHPAQKASDCMTPRTKIQLKPIRAKPIETSWPTGFNREIGTTGSNWKPVANWFQLKPIGQLEPVGYWFQLVFNWFQLFQFPYCQLVSIGFALIGFNWFQLKPIAGNWFSTGTSWNQLDSNWIQLELPVGMNLISYKLISICTNYCSCQHRSIVICLLIPM